jgi:putative ABC transport system permease protein
MRGWSWFTRRRRSDIPEEIATHLDMATRERIERGMAPDDARAAALREFGNVALIEQTTREVWAWTWLEQLVEDLRMGARILWHAPGLSATAIVLIALVVGGNTTIYSMVNSLLVSPARGVTAERLVVIRHLQAGVMLTDPFISYPNYADYARLATTVTGLTAWSSERLTLRTDNGNYAVWGGLVTANYFATLGVGIVHGRALDTADDNAANGVAGVISHRVWQERFAAAPNAIGRVVVVNRVPVTVVGVAAQGFTGAVTTPGEDVWLPISAYYRAIGNRDTLTNRSETAVLVAGRLAEDASLADARAEFVTLLAQLYAAYPDEFTTIAPQGGRVRLENPRASVAPYSANAYLPFADLAPRFLMAFSVVTLITLVIVSANVANLMLGRAVQRQRDTAVRQSLGAPRSRIVRLLVAEGATVALVAWAAACLCAWWSARALLRFLEPQPGLLEEVRPDWTFAAYAMLLALIATLACSAAPSLRAWRLNALPLLRAGEHGIVAGRTRLAGWLVVCQFTFSVLLVTSAGLAYRAMSLFDSGHVGFARDNLLLVTVRAGTVGAFVSAPSNPVEVTQGFTRLERIRGRLTQLPGSESVTYARRLPGDYFNATWPVWRENPPVTAHAFVRPVGPDYLRTLGLSVVAGRDITVLDARGARRTAVINRQLAAELFTGSSALGQTIIFGARREAVEIVGVAPDALFDGPIHDRTPAYVLIAEQQLPGPSATDPTYVVRYQGGLEAATSRVTKAIGEADSSVAIVAASTMNARLEAMGVFETFLTRLILVFAAISLLVATLGQYAVATFNAACRTRDFGVRLALGASAARVRWFVLREALRLVVPALIIGFALSAAVANVLRSALLDVSPLDPIAYGGAALLLVTASLGASYLPAWRAGRINVVDALRNE